MRSPPFRVSFSFLRFWVCALLFTTRTTGTSWVISARELPYSTTTHHWSECSPLLMETQKRKISKYFGAPRSEADMHKNEAFQKAKEAASIVQE